MKKVILIATFSIFALVSCNQKRKEVTTTDSEMMENDSTMMDNDSTMMNDGSSKKMMGEKMYACPMHPEVQGKLNDKCSKCGMKLTEPVAENAAE
jgi:Heavy metal binding domain